MDGDELYDESKAKIARKEKKRKEKWFLIKKKFSHCRLDVMKTSWVWDFWSVWLSLNSLSKLFATEHSPRDWLLDLTFESVKQVKLAVKQTQEDIYGRTLWWHSSIWTSPVDNSDNARKTITSQLDI